jgi:hypothetical protein
LSQDGRDQGRDEARDEGRVGEREERSHDWRDDAGQEGRVEARDEDRVEGGDGASRPPNGGYLPGRRCNLRFVSVLASSVMFRAFSVSNPVKAKNGGIYG